MNSKRVMMVNKVNKIKMMRRKTKNQIRKTNPINKLISMNVQVKNLDCNEE